MTGISAHILRKGGNIMQKLLIAIDPGFDTMKVVANGKVFKFPFNIVETDERKVTDTKLRPDFLLYQAQDGTTYRVGQYARELVFDNKAQIQNFYTEQRFVSPEFQVGIDTAVALAIEENGLYDVMDALDIYIMVALPHACRNTYASTISGAASGPHHFSLRRGTGVKKNYSYNIEQKHVMTVSQTIAAILGETSDDNGDINEEKYFYLSNGPTLVLDGGYYTMGMVVVSRGGSVEEGKTESDTHHAMANVNALVADAIKDKRPDVSHYAIEYLLAKDDGMIRYLENGHAVNLDLKKLREEKMKVVCSDLIEYLNKKYNDLLDFKYVLVTGGTGAHFYPQLLKTYSDMGIMDKEHMLLTSSILGDETHSIEFAITIGAYKGLRGVLAG